MSQEIKPEYVLLGLGAAGLTAYWYFFVRKPLAPPTGMIYVHVTGSMGIVTVHLKDRPVYLDGELVGHTDPRGDLYITDVEEGTHSVRVVAPDGWSPPEDTKSVIVPDGSVSFWFWFY